MSRLATSLAMVFASGALALACDLNPQPLPPGDNPDAAVAAPGIGGSSSSGGGTNTAGNGDGSASDATFASDAGKGLTDAASPDGNPGGDANEPADDAPSDAEIDSPEELDPLGD